MVPWLGRKRERLGQHDADPSRHVPIRDQDAACAYSGRMNMTARS